jgi:hypothetical protein
MTEERKARALLRYVVASLLQTAPESLDADEDDLAPPNTLVDDPSALGADQEPAAEAQVTESSVDLLASWTEHCIQTLGQRAQAFAELSGRAEVSIADIGRTLALFGAQAWCGSGLASV